MAENWNSDVAVYGVGDCDKQLPEMIYSIEDITVLVAKSASDPSAPGHIVAYKCKQCELILQTYHRLKQHTNGCCATKPTVDNKISAQREIDQAFSGNNHLPAIFRKAKVKSKLFSCSKCGKEFSWQSWCTRHEVKCTDTSKSLLTNDTGICNGDSEHKDIEYSTDYLSEKDIEHSTELANVKEEGFKIYDSDNKEISEESEIMLANDKPDTKCDVIGTSKQFGSVKDRKCPFCGKLFWTVSMLKRHIIVHTKEKNSFCKYCTKRFAYRQTATLHERRCTGKHYLPEQFDIEEKTQPGVSVQSSGVAETELSVKTSTEDEIPLETGSVKPESSDSGSEAVIDKNNIEGGLSDRICSICQRVFSAPSLLKRHMVVHTGDKPFSCSQCGMRFSWESVLKKHMVKCVMSQTVVKPNAQQSSQCQSEGGYRCMVCNKHFVDLGSFQKHVLEHNTGKDEKRSSIDFKEDIVEVADKSNGSCYDAEELSNNTDLYDETELQAVGSEAEIEASLNENQSQFFEFKKEPEEGYEGFRCEYCDIYLTSTEALEKHILTHRKLYPCSKCGKTFTSTHSQTKHKKTCRRSTKKAYYKIVNNQLVSNHQCPTCSKYFACSSQLERHITVHTKEKDFVCAYCAKPLGYKSALKRHELVCESNPSPNKHQVNTCSKCQKYFVTSDGLKLHESRCMGKKLALKPDAGNHQCSICNRVFVQKCNLNGHMRLHTGEKIFTCQKCNKEFAFKWQLNKHEKCCLLDNGGFRFFCSYCSKGFKHHTSLLDHERVHRGETPFRCKICNKSYLNKHNLNVHEKLHSGERPFQCNECGKCFPLRSSLNCHLKVHANQKNFKCDTCGKYFLFRGHLNRHLKIHSITRPFQCSVCPKTFKQNSALKEHEFLHTNQRPFKCKHCDMGFKRRSNLVYHEGTHVGLKRFECSICHQKYTIRANMLKHQRKHFEEDGKPLAVEQLHSVFSNDILLNFQPPLPN